MYYIKGEQQANRALQFLFIGTPAFFSIEYFFCYIS